MQPRAAQEPPGSAAGRHRVIWVLNAACPSRCVYCDIASQRSTRALSAEEVERVSHEIVGAGFREVVFVGGEPLLSAELPVALRVLGGRVRIAVFTGGLVGSRVHVADLVDQGISRLVLSMDSGRDALNDLVRGRKGITTELVALATELRERLPRLGMSVNTVVSRHNAGTLLDVWERMEPLGLDSWALTLVGDNFSGSPREHLLGRHELERFYLTDVPALAARLAERRAELVVLPVPFPLLAARVPAVLWGEAGAAGSAKLRAELDEELSLYAKGDYNRTFVRRCGCPLVGVDISIGVGGEVHPCSQAPALQPEFVVGHLRRERLMDVLAGEALATFGRAVPHPPCTRCWAPSNVERRRLLRVVQEAAR
jgi:MoaA/NifB/PqqE/SkfB family radical SAM enzyme